MKIVAFGLLTSLCLLLVGCNEDLKQQVSSLQAQARQDAARIAVLETHQAAAAEKIAVLQNQLAEKEVAIREQVSSFDGEKALLAKKLAEAEVNLGATNAKLGVFEAAQAKMAEEAAAAAKLSNLVVQLGVTMKSGETKPVTHATVYLMTSNLFKLAPRKYKAEMDSTFDASGGLSDILKNMGNTAAGVLVYSALYPKDSLEVMATIRGSAAFKATTDFNGRAAFSDIPRGSYFVLCITELGGGAVLEKSVLVQEKATFISLGNEDMLERVAD